MALLEADGYYFPPGFDANIREFDFHEKQRGQHTVRLKIPRVTRAAVEDLADYLKDQREKGLFRMPLAHIVDVLDRASRLWLDDAYELRRKALDTIPVMTGFSRETVAASIDVEMESSLADDMLRALKTEIGNPDYLDDFQYDELLQGQRRAYGPELMVSFFSENIPALPHLMFMRAALVKSGCLGKVASGEPTFAPLYLKTIESIDPDLARSMAVLYWSGGDAAVEDAAFNQADAVVFFGGVRALNSLIDRIPRRIRVLVHGHKLGFGVLGRRRMQKKGCEKLAASVAYDLSMFDQQACLAPHVYYVEEGGEVSPDAFAGMVAHAVDALNRTMPRGEITTAEAATINQLRGKYEMRELKGDDVALHASAGGTDWTVVYERDSGIFRPSPLNRFLRVVGVEDIDDILPPLKTLGPFLQNAAVDIGDKREDIFVATLGEYGVARITAPGNMPTPTMMWHHDGISPLASLLHWCDIEKKDRKRFLGTASAAPCKRIHNEETAQRVTAKGESNR